jgi:SAM-dependent methyltransferase
VEVHGVDASRKMVAKMRAKKGGRRVRVEIGDFASKPDEGAYRLVYVVFNTFFGLLTQEDQVRCFRNVARRLVPGGAFVLECFVPDPTRFDRGQRTSVFGVDDDVGIAAETHDAATQTARATLIRFEKRGVATYPVRIRYAWPSELDLMARIAGLGLRDRWSGWTKAPFTSSSGAHVSVYEKPR